METTAEVPARPTPLGVSGWLKLITAFVAIFAATVAMRYVSQPLLESYGFRQTQTAITAYWLLHGGSLLAYETPVGGYPWAIPFEFPIYQALAALIAHLGGFPLDAVGRLVSFAFLIGCAWPALGIARRLTLPRQVVWVFCALLWSSPIYLFWGRAFMIETAALFFAFASIPYALDLRERSPSRTAVLLCALFGTLAGLQKVTTGAPVTIVLGCIWLISWLRREGLRLPSVRDIAAPACAFGLPILVSALWSGYADAVKAANPLGAQLTSTALVRWNLGGKSQLLSLSTYVEVFWTRLFVANAGGMLGVALLAGAVLRPGVPRLRGYVLAALSMLILPILIFTNLHINHDYYQASCLLFLTGAVALTVAVWVPGVISHHAAVPALTLMLVTSNLLAFRQGYGPLARAEFQVAQHRILAIAEVLRDNTPPASGFVAFGLDWSSELAYYAQRKSFTVPRFFREYDRAWTEPARYLGDAPLGALVICPSPSPSVEQVQQKLDSDPQWILVEVLDCRVLLKRKK